MSHSWGRAQR